MAILANLVLVGLLDDPGCVPRIAIITAMVLLGA